MNAFRFSLQDLLRLRQRELQQLELRAAAEAAAANAARQLLQQLWSQLRQDAPQAFREQRWLVFRQAADALRQQAVAAQQRADQHDQARSQLDAQRIAKQTQVDALLQLRENQRREHHRQALRREDRQRDELLLRRWRDGQLETAEHDG